ncbi:MAG: hypothetical protein Q4A00_03600 [Flavobacteriaceae bacterium]|nr:hypothetical protein [Flavobacteriaceae bacterium]
MKKQILLAFILLWGSGFAQNVGINTKTPKANLHINGNLQITKSLFLGDNTLASEPKATEGKDGYFLMSRGEGKSPEWKKIEETFIPQEAGFLKSDRTTTAGIDNPAKVTFSEHSLQLNKYAIPSHDGFTIVLPGFYYVTAYLTYKITPSNRSENRLAATYIYRGETDIIHSTSGYITGNTTHLNHAITKVHYLNKGDKITLRGMSQDPAVFTEGGLSLQYFGGKEKKQ